MSGSISRVMALEEITRRSFLKKAGAVLAFAVASTVVPRSAYAKQLPEDLYPPRAPEVSEARFKETIARESAGQYLWVQYTFTETPAGRKLDDIFRQRGDAFWKVLKQEFPDARYMTIDITPWPSNGKANNPAQREIGSDDFPGFVLYQDRKIVKDKYNELVTIQGPPKDRSKILEWISYLKKDTPLK